MQPILDIFADSLIKNSDEHVTITGQMDNSNNDAINNPLSFDHVVNTRDYLMRKGVLSQLINVNGRGSHEPVTTNNTAASRAIYRRVEIYVFELLSSAFHHRYYSALRSIPYGCRNNDRRDRTNVGNGFQPLTRFALLAPQICL